MSSSSYAQQQWQFHAQSLSNFDVDRQFDAYTSYPQQQQSSQEFEYDFTEQSQHQSEHAVQGWPTEPQTSHFSMHNRGHGLRLDSLPINVGAFAPSHTYTSSPIDHSAMTWPYEHSAAPGYQTSEESELSPRAYSPYSGSQLSEDPLATNYSHDSMNIFDVTFGQCLESASPYENYYGNSPLHLGGSSSSSSSYSLSPPLNHEMPLLMQPLPSPPISLPVCAPTKASTTTASSRASKADANSHRRRFPCLTPGCARRFTSQYTLKVHMEAHKPKPRVTFPCTMGCSERFSRQHDRLRHEVAKHAKVCEHSCGDCGRFFSTQKTLGNHKCPVAGNGTRWVHA